VEITFQIKSADFVKSATNVAHYPEDNLPEVAFAGRSNVGKSSLINCILQRRKLVRTSKTPGQTRTINFFKINGSFYFVDLPGYGFARVPVNLRAQWGPMVEAYLTGRKNLKAVVQIIDARHPPTPDDLMLWHWLEEIGTASIPVLTKADKIKRAKWGLHTRQAASGLGAPPERMILFSASTGLGRAALWERLLGLLDFQGEHGVLVST
jgi:GTP-binding protein